MNMTIGKKMLAMGIGIFIGLGALGVVINRIDVNATVANQLSTLRTNQLDIINRVHEAQLRLMLAAMDSIVDKDGGKIDQERKQILDSSSSFIAEHLDELAELADTPEEKRLATELKVTAEQLIKGINIDLVYLIEKKVPAGTATEADFANIDNVLDTFGGGVEEALLGMQASVKDEVKEASDDLIATLNTMSTIGYTVFLLVVALFIPTFYLFSRGIVKPLQLVVEMIEEIGKGHIDRRLNMARNDEIGQMASTMDRFADSLQQEVVKPLQMMASGDLTFCVTPHDTNDQLRNALKKVGGDLNNLIAKIQSAGDQIDSASGQVSDSSQSLSQGATQTAAALEEISSSISQMASQVTQSAENANQANQLAAEASQVAGKGSQQMSTMITAMGEINEASQSIGKIIKVIDEIAFQTNLLALNAAVEAARAGQHGKGFAVVAEEVRNLAARSAKAAEETSELIEGSIVKTANGTQIAEQTSVALEEIVASSTKVTDLVAEIAAAGNEQAQGIAQINQGLGQIDEGVQQNTATAEESAAAAEELSSQAVQLKHMLSSFKLTTDQTQGISTPASTKMLIHEPGWANLSQQSPQPSIQLDDNEFDRY